MVVDVVLVDVVFVNVPSVVFICSVVFEEFKESWIVSPVDKSSDGSSRFGTGVTGLVTGCSLLVAGWSIFSIWSVSVSVGISSSFSSLLSSIFS